MSKTLKMSEIVDTTMEVNHTSTLDDTVDNTADNTGTASTTVSDGTQTSQAQVYKDQGNVLYHEKKYSEAIEMFSEAIQVDNNNEIYYNNRSMCYAALKNWNQSLTDAKAAVSIASKYHKAHYHVIKAYIHLDKLKSARLSLLYAIKECGDKKEFQQLEALIESITTIAVRPKPTHFDVIDQLGDGNFSKIYKVKYNQSAPKVRLFACISTTAITATVSFILTCYCIYNATVDRLMILMSTYMQ